MKPLRFLLPAALAAAFSCPAGADTLQFKDGRFVDAAKIVEAEGGYKIIYSAGEVFVKKDLVVLAHLSDSSGNYVPQNDEEKAKIEKGLVPFDGKWVSKVERDKTVQKRADEAKKVMEEAKKHQEWRDRYITETAHFKFEYTIPQAKCKEYQELMETYFNEFTRKWGIKTDAKTPKLPVCFYHDEEAYYQVSGAPRGAIGYFRFVAPIELNFYYDRNDERLTLDVMFHETNHYLTHLLNPKFDYPAWINESLAEYYGSSTHGFEPVLTSPASRFFGRQPPATHYQNSNPYRLGLSVETVLPERPVLARFPGLAPCTGSLRSRREPFYVAKRRHLSIATDENGSQPALTWTAIVLVDDPRRDSS